MAELTKEYAEQHLHCDMFVTCNGSVYAYDDSQEEEYIVTDKKTGELCFGEIDYSTMNVTCRFYCYRIGDGIEPNGSRPKTYYICYPTREKFAELYTKHKLILDKMQADSFGGEQAKSKAWYEDAEEAEDEWEWFDDMGKPLMPTSDFFDEFDRDAVWIDTI